MYRLENARQSPELPKPESLNVFCTKQNATPYFEQSSASMHLAARWWEITWRIRYGRRVRPTISPGIAMSKMMINSGLLECYGHSYCAYWRSRERNEVIEFPCCLEPPYTPVQSRLRLFGLLVLDAFSCHPFKSIWFKISSSGRNMTLIVNIFQIANRLTNT